QVQCVVSRAAVDGDVPLDPVEGEHRVEELARLAAVDGVRAGTAIDRGLDPRGRGQHVDGVSAGTGVNDGLRDWPGRAVNREVLRFAIDLRLDLGPGNVERDDVVDQIGVAGYGERVGELVVVENGVVIDDSDVLRP